MKQIYKDFFELVWLLFRLLVAFIPLVSIFIFGQYTLLILYIVLGLFVFLFLRHLGHTSKNDLIKTIIGSTIIWPIHLLFWNELYKKTKSNPISEYFAYMSKNGTTEDEIPNSIGKFAFVSTNPIPTDSIFGSEIYLGSLRDKNGNRIKYERIGSTNAQNISAPIDIYKIFNLNDEQIAIIYISPYQKTISKKVPEGFIIEERIW